MKRVKPMQDLFMKIIDCFWEKENLNKNVVEIVMEKSDSIDSVCWDEVEKKYDYIVIKVKINDADKYYKLQTLGYTFIESQLSISKKINQFDMNDKLIKRIIRNSSVEMITDENELNKLLSMMTEGMFNTDRIYIDKNFGPQWSLNRYKNWIKTEFDRNTKLCWMIFDKERVGFRLYKVVEGVYHGLLGGIFEKYQGRGIGLLTSFGGYLCSLENSSIKKIETKISSNNMEVLKLYNYLDFKIDNIHNVFVKVIDKSI